MKNKSGGKVQASSANSKATAKTKKNKAPVPPTKQKKNAKEELTGLAAIQTAVKKFLDVLPLDYLFAAFCAGFCGAGCYAVLTVKGTFTNLAFVTSVPTAGFIMCVLFIFLGLILLTFLLHTKKCIPITLFAAAVLYGSLLAYNNSTDIYTTIGVAFVLLLVCLWIAKDDKLGASKLNLPHKAVWGIAIALALLFTIVVSVVTVARYEGYMCFNFDFGIFAQMFEKMRTTGLANTTVERNVLMSHFGVHFSPIFYLLLPFYMIVPRPETLLVLQALFVAGGVFAVVLICKRLKLSTNISIAFVFIYLFFPSLANGCLYDFHENKFLTVLIMWTLYFVISKKTIPTFIFAGLTLMVKEDAAIYIIAIALYILLAQKERLKGLALLIIGIIYFIIATNIVSSLGDGIMISRLDNYIPTGESGFLAVAKTCFFNFGYFLSQIFTQDKILFMLWMFLPLCFAPFMGEKKSVLLLLVPMLVIDLMSNWKYQYDINYQYTFGVAALLVFMSILAMENMKPVNRRVVVLMSCAMCCVMSCSLFVSRSQTYLSNNTMMKSTTTNYNNLIQTIPKDASVTADNNYIPHMYDFTDLYMYPNYYAASKQTDYLLVSATNVSSNSDDLKTFMGDSYELIGSAGNMQLYKLK